MRSVGIWLFVVALTAVLLFLMYPVALTAFTALLIVFTPNNPWGPPWFWLIATVLFASPLAVVALIFAGTLRSLRR